MMNQLLRYAPVVRLIRRIGPCRVLEVGCGSQGLGKFLSTRFVGVDVDFSDFTGLPRSLSPWMLPVRASGTCLPFRSETFDLVILLDVLEHVRPAARSPLLAECARVARQALVVAFPCGRHAEALDRDFAHWLAGRSLPEPGWLRDHLQHPFPTVDEVEAPLRDRALRVRVVDNAWLPAHRLVLRWEGTRTYAPYSALLSDLLAPTAWKWRTPRLVTNLLRLIARPAWPLLRLLEARPAYRKLVVAEKRARADGAHGGCLPC